MSANSKELLKFLKSQIGELDDEESQNVDMYAEDNSTIVVTLTDYYESELLSDFAMRLPELANEQGWFITNENELDEAPDQVALYLHPKEGVKVDVPKYVYHVTQSSKVEQILKSGLQPKRGVNNHGFKYPPRVYVASDPQILQNMDLGISGDRTLLKIDTSKIPDIKFYDDPQFPHDGQWRSAYANETIPSEAISVNVAESVKIASLLRNLIREIMVEIQIQNLSKKLFARINLGA